MHKNLTDNLINISNMSQIYIIIINNYQKKKHDEKKQHQKINSDDELNNHLKDKLIINENEENTENINNI